MSEVVVSTRSSASRLRVLTPLSSTDAANKDYVDNRPPKDGSVTWAKLAPAGGVLSTLLLSVVSTPGYIIPEGTWLLWNDTPTDPAERRMWGLIRSQGETLTDIIAGRRALALMDTDPNGTGLDYIDGKLSVIYGTSSGTACQGDDPRFTTLQSSVSSKEPTIAAGTTSQYYRGDKSWQTLNASAVGLNNVDNTADASKSVLSATKLTTARTINGVSFDGTANITVSDSTKVDKLGTSTGVWMGTLSNLPGTGTTGVLYVVTA